MASPKGGDFGGKGDPRDDEIAWLRKRVEALEGELIRLVSPTVAGQRSTDPRDFYGIVGVEPRPKNVRGVCLPRDEAPEVRGL